MSDQTQKMIEWLDSHGCTNHGCDVIWTKRNVGTNAMCSCLRDMPYYHLTRAMYFHRILRDDLIEELKDSIMVETAPGLKVSVFDLIEDLKAKLARVEAVRKELATQTLNSHAVKMLDKALENDDG